MFSTKHVRRQARRRGESKKEKHGMEMGNERDNKTTA